MNASASNQVLPVNDVVDNAHALNQNHHDDQHFEEINHVDDFNHHLEAAVSPTIGGKQVVRPLEGQQNRKRLSTRNLLKQRTLV